VIQLDRIGVWASMNGTTAAATGCPQRVQAGDYGAPGLPESGGRNVAKQSGECLLFGLGVSHVPLVAGLHGHIYGKRVETMRAHMEAMGRASYAAAPPPEPPRTGTAALGPNA
jgi:hypothetical protein